jgi:hypothetical protein
MSSVFFFMDFLTTFMLQNAMIYIPYLWYPPHNPGCATLYNCCRNKTCKCRTVYKSTVYLTCWAWSKNTSFSETCTSCTISLLRFWSYLRIRLSSQPNTCIIKLTQTDYQLGWVLCYLDHLPCRALGLEFDQGKYSAQLKGIKICTCLYLFIRC